MIRRLSPATAAVLTVLIASLALPMSAVATSRTLGLGGWQVQSSSLAGRDGAAVSQPRLRTRSWLHVTPDGGGAPGTEVEALVQNGRCPHVFYSTNMRRCFGSMSAIGRDTIPQFAVPWWFRTTFRSALGSGQHAQLIVNGVVGQADVWLNGHRIAGQSTVQGDYTQYSFDVTGRLRLGVNAVALQVHPNNPNRMFTLDSVDWSQIPPDNNTGIQFPVQLHSFGALGLSDAHVIQHDSATASTAALTVRAQVDNAAAGPRSGVLRATVTSPGGRSIVVRRAVSLPARARREITLTPASYPQLRIVHPRAWWPYQMGAQPLYRLRVSVAGPAAGPDVATETFGIRTITTRLVGASPLAPHGSRQFYVNGRPFVFRAGGWAENLFLHYSSADTANQIAIIRNLGLNGIRTEGKEMPADFYEQMDRAGILVDAGFQCCDAWQLQDSKLTTTHDYAVLRLSALTIGRRLRNHPSIINFSWSDNTPTPRQAAVSVAAFHQADFQEPLIASAEYKSAPGLGWSGEKEGPYDWVPPSYWYDTGHYDAGDSSRTNAGGAWAFDSEASAGATIPTIDSIDRFLSPDEQAALWQQPDVNQYHLNYEPDLPSSANGGYSFGTLHDLDQAITNRYGSWTNLGQYVEEAQLQNYETQRAEFEAYIAHSHDAQAPSTGIVYWQLNKGWPTMLWDLYNNDYDQAGSYFGAQEANHPLHAIYRYDDGSVSIDNLTGTAARGVTVQARVFDVAGHLLSDQTSNGRTVAGDGVNSGVLHPSVPAATTPPTPARTYFVELVLRRGRAVVDRNVYWLSTQSDAVDWTKTIGNPQATMTGWADLKGLRDLPAATVASTASTHAAGRGESETDVTITNTSQTSAAAFFLRADLRRGNLAGTPAGGGDEVLPVQWSDDDITLWPGESQTLHVRYRTAALRGAAPVVTLSGFNVSPHQIAARWTAAGARVKTSP